MTSGEKLLEVVEGGRRRVGDDRIEGVDEGGIKERVAIPGRLGMDWGVKVRRERVRSEDGYSLGGGDE